MADKFVRASGQLVTPKDDSKIYNHIFGTGLFSLPTITYSGTTLHVTAFDGIVQGHDFHFDEQDVAATLGSTTSAATLYLYADFNLLASPILSLKTAFSEPSYSDDLNASGTHQTMLLASYTATLSAVTGVTVSSSINLMQTSVAEKVDTIISEQASGVACNYNAGDFFLYNGKLYRAKSTFSNVTLTDSNISTYGEVQSQTAINTLNEGLTVKDITSQLGAPSGMKVVEIGNILYINIAGTKVEDVRQWRIPQKYCSSLGNVRFSGIATQGINGTGSTVGLPALLAYPGKDSASEDTSLMSVTVINTSWKWQGISSGYYIFASAVIPL